MNLGWKKRRQKQIHGLDSEEPAIKVSKCEEFIYMTDLLSRPGLHHIPISIFSYLDRITLSHCRLISKQCKELTDKNNILTTHDTTYRTNIHWMKSLFSPTRFVFFLLTFACLLVIIGWRCLRINQGICSKEIKT